MIAKIYPPKTESIWLCLSPSSRPVSLGFVQKLTKWPQNILQMLDWKKQKEIFTSSLETIGKIIGVEVQIQDDNFLDLMSCRGSIFSLAQAFDAANNLYKQLLELKWRFLFSATRLKFITSDNPIYCYSEHDTKTIKGDRIISEDIEVTIPLSKKVSLVAMRENIQAGYGDASGMIIKTINKRTVMGAKDNIYTSFNDETFMKFVQKNKDIRPYMAIVSG